MLKFHVFTSTKFRDITYKDNYSINMTSMYHWDISTMSLSTASHQ